MPKRPSRPRARATNAYPTLAGLPDPAPIKNDVLQLQYAGLQPGSFAAIGLVVEDGVCRMKLGVLFALAIGSAFGLSSYAQAARTACPAAYLDGQAPTVTNRIAVTVTQEVCQSLYAIAYSGPNRVPAWSAVRLTATMADGGDHIARIKPAPFHDEPGVNAQDRSTYGDSHRRPRATAGT